MEDIQVKLGVVALVALLGLVGCTAGKSAVQIGVISDKKLDQDVTQFKISAVVGGRTSQDTLVTLPSPATIPTDASMPATFALRFESSLEGDVSLSVTAKNGDTVLGIGSASIVGLKAGKMAAPVLVTLVKGAMPPDNPDGGPPPSQDAGTGMLLTGGLVSLDGVRATTTMRLLDGRLETTQSTCAMGICLIGGIRP